MGNLYRRSQLDRFRVFRFIAVDLGQMHRGQRQAKPCFLAGPVEKVVFGKLIIDLKRTVDRGGIGWLNLVYLAAHAAQK